ncbi:M20/M25/M40 family metallo-hydrolase [Evansella sp. LMS18]|uniref:M20 family metallopeptidase n=1 Tax=Evansella sp. LMS18 TaxID=2924033 RepID=UPI0020D1E649|nr:M20/M25/M40 family metallo-hydrolase [Evansella sp. LMS18]UTR12760.1 M20/M25/M40 family metallo-hydrolase [Evansella sp. LMS18]
MNDPVPLTEELIRINSTTKEGANEAVDYCAKWLEERGLHVKILVNNGYRMAVSEIGSGDRTIIFNGHVDVVEAEDDQFSPYIEDGKLYGRGAVDMKGGLAAMMTAAVLLKDVDLGCKLQIQIVPDEETGGMNGTKYLTEQGYLGDFIICGEPTNYGIAIQSLGVIQMDIDIRGKSAHGSRPWEGVNAIEKAYNLYQQILELPFTKETAPPMYDSTSVNLAKLHSGSSYNKVPESCTISFDIRYIPTQSPDEIIRQIDEITDGEVIIQRVSDPVTTKEDNPYVQALAKSLVNQTDLEKANIYGQRGSNDGKYFTKYGGASVEFGPLGKNWHSEKELVFIDSVRTYENILVDFVLSWSKQARNKE